jgi:hypothetical protein
MLAMRMRKKDPSNPAREIVNARLRPDLLRRLEAQIEIMRPIPTKSQLIEWAVEELLARLENPKKK